MRRPPPWVFPWPPDNRRTGAAGLHDSAQGRSASDDGDTSRGIRAEVVRIVCCSGGALSPSDGCCESRATLPLELYDHWPILLLELLEPPEVGPIVELGVDSHLVQLAIYSSYLD